MKWLDEFLSMMEAGINHANNQSDLGIATTIPLDAFEFSETKNFLNAKVNITRDDFGTHTVEVEIARLRVSPLNDDFEDDEITQDGALLTNEQWQIAFYVDGSMVDATGEGYEMQIIAVVQAAVEYFLNMYRPLRIKFHAADHEGYMGKIKVRGSQERVGGRERVYRIFARGLTRKYGYTDFSEGRDFLLVRDDEAQGEVFDPAGGKKGFLGQFQNPIDNDLGVAQLGKPSSEISEQAKKGIKNKVEEHNQKFAQTPSKKVNYRMLSAVFRRGKGAYYTNPSSVRPTVKSADQWAYARVNNFLRTISTGKFRSGKHDTDLLPKGHRLSTR